MIKQIEILNEEKNNLKNKNELDTKKYNEIITDNKNIINKLETEKNELKKLNEELKTENDTLLNNTKNEKKK